MLWNQNTMTSLLTSKKSLHKTPDWTFLASSSVTFLSHAYEWVPNHFYGWNPFNLSLCLKNVVDDNASSIQNRNIMKPNCYFEKYFGMLGWHIRELQSDIIPKSKLSLLLPSVYVIKVLLHLTTYQLVPY